MSIDVPLLRKELEYITAHREHWNQGTWLNAADTSCGTVGCLAGNTLLHTGNVECYSVVETRKVYYTPIGQWSWGWEAKKVLGLSICQADHLFYEHNTLHDLWRLANEYTSGEIEIPLEVETAYLTGTDF